MRVISTSARRSVLPFGHYIVLASCSSCLKAKLRQVGRRNGRIQPYGPTSGEVCHWVSTWPRHTMEWEILYAEYSGREDDTRKIGFMLEKTGRKLLRWPFY